VCREIIETKVNSTTATLCCNVTNSCSVIFLLASRGRLKMRDWKMSDENAGLEFDGLATRVRVAVTYKH